MNKDSRQYVRDPVKIKLWEIMYSSVYRTPELEQRKKKGKSDDCLVVDFGNSLTRAVSGL